MVYSKSCKLHFEAHPLRIVRAKKQYLYDDAGNRYLDKADNNVWAFAEFHLGKNIWFHVKAGHSVLRKYRQYNMDDEMTLKLGPVNVGDDRWGGWDDANVL